MQMFTQMFTQSLPKKVNLGKQMGKQMEKWGNKQYKFWNINALDASKKVKLKQTKTKRL